MNHRQFQTVLWLRWRLSRNQLARSGPLGMAIFVLLIVLGGLAALASAGGGFLLGMLALEGAPSSMHLVLWSVIIIVFLFFWLMGLMIEVQREESLNVERFLHLPVSLRQIFTFNFLASHLSPVVLIFLPGMLTMALGLTFARGPAWLLMIPMILAFLFAVSSWTYYLRGWLASIMANKRRRRAIAVGITMSLILLGQLPNLYLNFLRPESKRPGHSPVPVTNQVAAPDPNGKETPQAVPSPASTPAPADAHGKAPAAGRKDLPPVVFDVLPWIPPLWVGHAAMSLAEGAVGPVLAYFVIFLMAGLLGFRIAYRATLRFYTGRQRVSRATQKVAGRPANWLDSDVPFLPRQVGTMTLAFLRSILRAPEMKMALFTPLIILVIFGSVILRRSAGSPNVAGSLLPSALAYSVLMGLLQLTSNQFGFDRHGFRALVLLPMRRMDILMAKNAALLPLALSLNALGLAALAILGKTHWTGVTAGALQFMSGYLVLCMVGNLGSILAPFRVSPGSMKRSKPPARSMLSNFVIHLLFPILLIPVALPVILQILCDWKHWWPGVPVAPIGSVLVFAVCLLAYGLVLPRLGVLLQSREKEILDVVTREMD